MRKKVLIFDDDQDILNICKIILTAKNYEVWTESSCEQIFERILEFRPDVIVMDNKIPEIGGVEATRAIKKDQRTAEIPVILFSANTHIAELTRQAGADLYIQKPFDIAQFEQALADTISRRKYSNNEAV